MNFQKTKRLAITTLLSALSSVTVLGMEEIAGKAEELSPIVNERAFQNDDILFALTGQKPDGDAARQALVVSAKDLWDSLTRDFTDKAIEPTLEGIEVLRYLHPMLEIGYAYPVTEKTLEATLFLMHNKGRGLKESKIKPKKDEVIAAQLLLERGAPTFTDADFEATMQLQSRYNMFYEEKPSLIKIYAVRQLLKDHDPNFIHPEMLEEFTRLYELMGAGDAKPHYRVFEMGIDLSKESPNLPKPSLEEIHEAIQMREEKQNYRWIPNLTEVRERVNAKKRFGAKFVELEMEKNAPEERRRLASEGFMIFIGGKQIDDFTFEHACLSLILRSKGIEKPTPRQVLTADSLSEQQEGSAILGIPLDKLTIEHIEAFSMFDHEDFQKKVLRIQTEFWNDHSGRACSQ